MAGRGAGSGQRSRRLGAPPAVIPQLFQEPSSYPLPRPLPPLLLQFHQHYHQHVSAATVPAVTALSATTTTISAGPLAAEEPAPPKAHAAVKAAAEEEPPPKKKQKRNKPTLSCLECVERKTKVRLQYTPFALCLMPWAMCH
jgi:hypothetical protein